jgi:hypothetical protein
MYISKNNKLNSIVGEKILETFPPNEVQKYHALNYVGQFTPGLKYEGAALQARRVGMIEKTAPSLGATAAGYGRSAFGTGPSVATDRRLGPAAPGRAARGLAPSPLSL